VIARVITRDHPPDHDHGIPGGGHAARSRGDRTIHPQPETAGPTGRVLEPDHLRGAVGCDSPFWFKGQAMNSEG